jgi:hypothetical protein
MLTVTQTTKYSDEWLDNREWTRKRGEEKRFWLNLMYYKEIADHSSRTV